MEIIPFDKRIGFIWYNGEFVEWQNATTHVLNHGLHYASCVFEGVRVYGEKIYKLEQHTDRLFHSAAMGWLFNWLQRHASKLQRI